MRKKLQTCLVGLCITVMIINPVLACCGGWGGGWSGGYYGGYHSCGPVYYGPTYSGCGGCGGCYEVVVDDCCGGCSSVAKVTGGSSGGRVTGPSAKTGEHSMQKNSTPAPEPPVTIETPAPTLTLELGFR